jgi:hypothetical protein
MGMTPTTQLTGFRPGLSVAHGIAEILTRAIALIRRLRRSRDRVRHETAGERPDAHRLEVAGQHRSLWTVELAPCLPVDEYDHRR